MTSKLFLTILKDHFHPIFQREIDEGNTSPIIQSNFKFINYYKNTAPIQYKVNVSRSNFNNYKFWLSAQILVAKC